MCEQTIPKQSPTTKIHPHPKNNMLCVRLTFGFVVVLLCAQTPLHQASANGDADIVLMLLEHGADPTLKDVCCVMCDIFWGSFVLCGCVDVCASNPNLNPHIPQHNVSKHNITPQIYPNTTQHMRAHPKRTSNHTSNPNFPKDSYSLFSSNKQR